MKVSRHTADEEEVTHTVGMVVDCTQLNVRSEPDQDATVLCTVPAESILLIDLGESSRSWFKVYTEVGIEGFCMRQYIQIQD